MNNKSSFITENDLGYNLIIKLWCNNQPTLPLTILLPKHTPDRQADRHPDLSIFFENTAGTGGFIESLRYQKGRCYTPLASTEISFYHHLLGTFSTFCLLFKFCYDSEMSAGTTVLWMTEESNLLRVMVERFLQILDEKKRHRAHFDSLVLSGHFKVKFYQWTLTITQDRRWMNSKQQPLESIYLYILILKNYYFSICLLHLCLENVSIILTNKQ